MYCAIALVTSHRYLPRFVWRRTPQHSPAHPEGLPHDLGNLWHFGFLICGKQNTLDLEYQLTTKAMDDPLCVDDGVTGANCEPTLQNKPLSYTISYTLSSPRQGSYFESGTPASLQCSNVFILNCGIFSLYT